jgi:DNA repair protein RecN (Recombination protein N)
MLEHLDVKDFALIDNLTVSFKRGLNILTGETGAGKSILVGALGLLLGMKGDTGSIRTGCDETVVNGTINVENIESAQDWLEQRDIKPEDGRIIIRRVVKSAGRGSIFIQSASVTRGDLREFTSLLFDIHGQHEHQSLLSPDTQRNLLDRFGGHEQEAVQFSSDFQYLSSQKKKYEEMARTERERLREMDILEYAVNEIDKARLQPGEEEELEKEKRILSQHEELYNHLDTIHKHTSENRGGALADLRQALHSLREAAEIDETLTSLSNRIEQAFYEIEDITDTIRQYQFEMQFSAERLDECEQRLMTIHNLAKKYGDSIEDILRYRQESKEKIEALSNWEEDKESLNSEIRDLEKGLYQKARELTESRKKAGAELESKVRERLHVLGMPKAVFHVEIQPRRTREGKQSCTGTGFDTVEFTISPNIGEPPKPLREIVSGGELSRIMLAIKSILAETDEVASLIFDEVDSGIGGNVAASVGEHLHNVSQYKQVLCITHLATIAVRADNHLKVEKREKDRRTVTEIYPVEGEERVLEIARMLSGDTKEKASLVHAQELLKKFESVT